MGEIVGFFSSQVLSSSINQCHWHRDMTIPSATLFLSPPPLAASPLPLLLRLPPPPSSSSSLLSFSFRFLLRKSKFQLTDDFISIQIRFCKGLKRALVWR